MAEPSEPTPVRVATLDDVYVAFNEIGKRDPNFEAGEPQRFVGMEYTSMRLAVNSYFNPGGAEIEQPPIVIRPPEEKKNVPQTVAGEINLSILEKILRALDPLKVIREEVAQALKKKVADSFPGLDKALDAIHKQLNSNMLTIIPNTLSLVGAALGGVENLIATVLSNSADIGDIEDVVVGAVKGNSGGISGFFMNLLIGEEWNLAGEIGLKITGAFVPDGGETDKVMSIVESFAGLPPPVDI